MCEQKSVTYIKIWMNCVFTIACSFKISNAIHLFPSYYKTFWLNRRSVFYSNSDFKRSLFIYFSFQRNMLQVKSELDHFISTFLCCFSHSSFFHSPKKNHYHKFVNNQYTLWHFVYIFSLKKKTGSIKTENNTDWVDVVSMAQPVKMNMEKHVTLESNACMCVVKHSSLQCKCDWNGPNLLDEN